MPRITGLGGIFFRAQDVAAQRDWYRRHLELDVQDWNGTNFEWQERTPPHAPGTTVWSLFRHDTTYFGPTGKAFMLNYRVADLHALLATLRAEGVDVDEKTEESEFGRFGWITDPEGNRIELWEPPPGA